MLTPHPRWTLLGTLATPARGLVDTRGRVATAPGLGLDWWVGAEDRWHLPQHEASVRQHLVGDAPVVETAMRVPGGDALHRAYVVRDRDGEGEARDLLVVEIENRSAVPFAVALVVAPFDPYAPVDPATPSPAGPAPGALASLVLDGTVLWVDGQPGLLLAKVPARAASVVAGGDLEALVTSGEAPAGLDPVSCAGGGAEAALIYPLPHTAVLRLAMPLDAARRSASPGPSAGGDESRAGVVGEVAGAEQVAKGWEAQTRRPMSVTLPDARWTAVTDANRAFLLLGAGDAASWADAAPLTGALDRWGFAVEAAQQLARMGDVGPAHRRADADALLALADHLALTGDAALVDQQASAIADAVRRTDRPSWRDRRADRRSGTDPRQDATRRSRALRAAATLLAAIDQPDAARTVGDRARRLADDPAVPLGTDVTDATASGPGAAPAVGHPGWTGALSPARTLARATLELATVDLAAAEAVTGAPAEADGPSRLADRVSWALAAAGPTLVWPEAIDPDRPLEALGRGHDARAGAAWLTFVRTLLVREAGSDQAPELALCSWLPAEWRGQGFEVHHAPTAHGELSYAVRWHGDRPALLWELEPRAGDPGPVTLRAPGLDAGWSTREPRGDALLAPIPAGGATAPASEAPDPPAVDLPSDPPAVDLPADPPTLDLPSVDDPSPDQGASFS